MVTNGGPQLAASPTVWRRWLAFELRRMRNEANLSQQQVGKQCGWSGARVSLLEVAGQTPTTDDLEKLLPLYGLAAEEWPRYIDACSLAAEKGWWERYDRREVPEWLSLYVGLEQGASMIQVYEPLMIPGLLQTREYAADVLRHHVVRRAEAHIERLVDLRMNRQQALTRDDNPLELTAIMDESALRRRPGTIETMEAQLRCLARMAARDNITVQILPADTWAMSFASTAFQHLSFPWPNDPGILHVEYRSGAIYVDDPYEIDTHTFVLQGFSEAALGPDESLDLLQQYINKEINRG